TAGRWTIGGTVKALLKNRLTGVISPGSSSDLAVRALALGVAAAASPIAGAAYAAVSGVHYGINRIQRTTRLETERRLLAARELEDHQKNLMAARAALAALDRTPKRTSGGWFGRKNAKSPAHG